MYLYVCDTTVNESEHFESFESVEDSHMSKILEYKLDDLYFIHLFPDIVFESIHSFLNSRNVTMMSISELSLLRTFSFSLLAGAYIQIISISIHIDFKRK